MSYEYYIGQNDEESVLAECGPMRLVIRAWNGEQPLIKLSSQAAEESIAYLEQVAQHRPLLSRPTMELAEMPDNALVQKMITSTGSIGAEDLTPMAAVAGTIADTVADWLFERGPTKVIVDNGGDIAVRLAPGEKVAVGVRPQVNSPHISHVIRLKGCSETWGVTTSGMGGRSFTRGIASAVSVLAANASVADAAATAVANACFVADDGIIRLPAETIDASSDLKGTHITTEIGPLNLEKIRAAIQHAKQKADYLAHKRIIVGAFIALDDVYSITDGLREYISPAEDS